MAYEIDGQGNILVHIFTVRFDDGDSQTRCFIDHTAGWNWARAEGAEWEGIDASNSYEIEYDSEWVENTDDAIEAFMSAHDSKED